METQLAASEVTLTTVSIPRIGQQWQGGLYAGIARGVNGAPDYHLVLLAAENNGATWPMAKAWAADLGGELPTRHEQSLLFANLKEEFQRDWYWSGEQHASAPVCAWSQFFTIGGQYCYDVDYGCRARAVRRLPIQ